MASSKKKGSFMSIEIPLNKRNASLTDTEGSSSVIDSLLVKNTNDLSEHGEGDTMKSRTDCSKRLSRGREDVERGLRKEHCHLSSFSDQFSLIDKAAWREQILGSLWHRDAKQREPFKDIEKDNPELPEDDKEEPKTITQIIFLFSKKHKVILICLVVAIIVMLAAIIGLLFYIRSINQQSNSANINPCDASFEINGTEAYTAFTSRGCSTVYGLRISGNFSNSSLVFPNLVNVSQSLDLQGIGDVGNISFPDLRYTFNLTLNGTTASGFEVPVLHTVDGKMEVNMNLKLKSLRAGNLTSVGNSLQVQSLVACPELIFPSLQTAGSIIFMNIICQKIYFPNLLLISSYGRFSYISSVDSLPIVMNFTSLKAAVSFSINSCLLVNVIDLSSLRFVSDRLELTYITFEVTEAERNATKTFDSAYVVGNATDKLLVNSVEIVLGTVQLTGIYGLFVIRFHALTKCNLLSFSKNYGIIQAEFPALLEVSNILIEANVYLETFSAASLQKVVYCMQFLTNVDLKVIDFPSTSGVIDFFIAGCESLQNISFPNMTKGSIALVNNNALVNASFPEVVELSFLAVAGVALVELSIPKLQKVDAVDFLPQDVVDREYYSQMLVCRESMILYLDILSFDFINIETAQNTMRDGFDTVYFYLVSVENLIFPALETVAGGMLFSSLPKLKTIQAPLLTKAASVILENNPVLDTVSFPLVQEFDGTRSGALSFELAISARTRSNMCWDPDSHCIQHSGMYVANNTQLSTLSLPQLRLCNSTFNITDSSGLQSINFPSLQKVLYELAVTDNVNLCLGPVPFPALTYAANCTYHNNSNTAGCAVTQNCPSP
eukprot:Nk52_evm4s224 gene=Nk52_evmTU4s224